LPDLGEQNFPIVGIGASAGGLDPIIKILSGLPIETGMAFVVIQHLAQGQESLLPEILSRSTKMNVLQVKNGMKVEKNKVYVITPGKTMTLKNGCLRLVPKGLALKPINDFMISLASERKTQAVGIVLSGTGNDGTEGLKTIKVEGGITFVQDPETAQYSDMPKNAIVAETAYFILSPENIVKELVRISKNPQLARTQSEAPQQAEGETDLKKIVVMLKASSGVDFTHYKETTINRRIARRRVVNKIENDKEYVTFLRTHPNELLALFDDLLIGVTSFFREPKTFEALKEKVFPELIKNQSANESIRVWIPGCSTGEEVYSVAIAIQEYLEENAIADVRIQIFGTDANEKNIEKARQGIYPKTIEAYVSENRLKRFFNKQTGNYQITKLIRDMCIFAKQDITNDPPFSNLDLIMCRNVLIYFDSLLHERVFPIFHYGLKPNSFLVLGESESIGKFNYLFEPVTTKGLIFKKKRAQPQAVLHPETFVPYATQRITIKQPEKLNSMTLLKEEVDRLLIAEYVPATLLVNNNLDILVFRGQVNPYLIHESGTANLNVTKMVRKELRTNVQTAVYRARKENNILKETVQFKHEGKQKTVTIQVKPLKTADYIEPFFIITFEEATSQLAHSHKETESTTAPTETETAKDKQINELKGDLESTKGSLQTIIEVQEATNEELRSTMEEEQSSNEELQSTNEEMETAKEELQSSNEELQTLNEELKNRNQALGLLTDDLTNLIENVDVTVVMVDNDLKIRRLTASAQALLNILPSDVGRSITNIHLGLPVEDLDKAVATAINKLTAVRQEIPGNQGHYYEMWIRPYLTADKKINGAVFSFVDITERKLLENERKHRTEDLERQVGEQATKLVQSERLAAIGATAGMVGHDIRNPLQAIISGVYLGKADLASCPDSEGKRDALESLDEIGKNVDYINKIVADLQDYARSLKPVAKETDLEDVIDDVLLKTDFPQGIKTSCHVEEDAKKVIADPDLLKRIISNLVINAVQAMPNGGELSVNAYSETNAVVLTVEDTGDGIPEEVKPKLFTPLFTTKAKGQGFGLAVVKRITEALGGTITFESQNGKGTKFILRFPRPKS